ncbi:hypothetical protein DLAC_10731 [Tieghemostelium lacteum]|uniref:FNIP repeat-containing protein n=1 Tax=Tieghemostelium lacteum TaxID=361077 RepID=A0A151Z419_TIELA|nr:hypothetical protein DLAC_10731 [Tieghemostelium lacteum]|eukprot:KYQ88710.1 hypothetical protein DLAC_10731 [Tieghemostelium lacteum]
MNRNIFNIIIVVEITNYLPSNRNVLSLLFTNKLIYSFRSHIRFLEYPSTYYFNNIKNQKKLDNIPLKFSSIKFTSLFSYKEFIKKCSSSLSITTLDLVYMEKDGLIESIPRHFDKILLPRTFNQHIPAGFFKDSVTLISFGNVFSNPLSSGVLPENLQTLILSDAWNHTIEDRLLPITLTHLEFGYKFNGWLPKLPPNLITLKFGYDFNSPIDHCLPITLENLIFSSKFDQPIENINLPRLKSLYFGNFFNQPVSAMLSDSIEVLEFSGVFNQPLTRLPKNLKRLRLSLNFSYDIPKEIIPESLQKLSCSKSYKKPILKSIQKNKITKY